MSTETVEAGWWQASDGNWYPPQLPAVEPPAPSPSWLARHRRLVITALAVLVGGSLSAATLSFRSSADTAKRREHEQQARADGLQADLDTAREDARSAHNDLDVANSDLTDVRGWSTDAETALEDYATCVEDLASFGDNVADALSKGDSVTSLEAESRRIGLECERALDNGSSLQTPPAGTS